MRCPHHQHAFYSEYDRKWYVANDHLASRFGFLYAAYEPGVWFWEVLEMGRKLFFTGLLIFIAPGSPSQMVIAILAGLAWLVVATLMQPYQSDSDDLLATIASTEIVLLTFAALLIKADVSRDDAYNYTMFSVVLSVVVFSPVATAFVLVLYNWLGPITVEWAAENQRRSKGGLPPQGLLGFIARMCCGKAPKRDADGLDGLTSIAAEALASARGTVVKFNAVSARAGFLLRQQLLYATRLDAQLRNMAKWSRGDATRCPPQIAAAHDAMCGAIRDLASDFGVDTLPSVEYARAVSDAVQKLSDVATAPDAWPQPAVTTLTSQGTTANPTRDATDADVLAVEETETASAQGDSSAVGAEQRRAEVGPALMLMARTVRQMIDLDHALMEKAAVLQTHHRAVLVRNGTRAIVIADKTEAD